LAGGFFEDRHQAGFFPGVLQLVPEQERVAAEFFDRGVWWGVVGERRAGHPSGA
jgi:hypothetical protein